LPQRCGLSFTVSSRHIRTGTKGRQGVKAPLHPEQQARLVSLRGYDILDTEPEGDFDEIVQVVSEVCGVPVSLVSLVDENRQWFKAKTGLDISETPLEASVCSHGILQPDILEIRDLTKDVRTIDNPIVAGDPKFRFYAGAALVNDEGYPLGMLCVLDYQPRQLTQTQRDLLRVMAKLVMQQIELRRSLKQEKAARTLVQEFLEKANVLLERNTLLRHEIDHRVKNSLTQVAAFLRLQERENRDEPRIVQALAEARGRVTTVANVHDHLHRSAEDDQASVAQFLKDLVAALSQNRSSPAKTITVEADTTRLPSDKVMAVGLAVNELVANAIKHGDADHIAIAFRTDNGDAVLTVTDNGPGLPQNFDSLASKGLGMRVLTSLAQQLRGSLVHDSRPQRTVFTIRFPLKPAAS
jgi:two-component sensor histidine kinase